MDLGRIVASPSDIIDFTTLSLSGKMTWAYKRVGVGDAHASEEKGRLSKRESDG